MSINLQFCGASKAKRHLGITWSVIGLSFRLSSFTFAFSTCIPWKTDGVLNGLSQRFSLEIQFVPYTCN